MMRGKNFNCWTLRQRGRSTAQRKPWEPQQKTLGTAAAEVVGARAETFDGDGASDVAGLERQTSSGKSAGGTRELLGSDNRKGVDHGKDQEESG
jgi:hypothetical protein